MCQFYDLLEVRLDLGKVDSQADHSGPVDTTVVTVTSQSDTTVFDTVTDTTTVIQVAGVSLVPDRIGAADPGEMVSYAHVLSNTGNGTDTFTLSAVSWQGWAVSHSPDPTLASGVSTTVYLTLTVPADVLAGTEDETTLTGGSQFDEGVSATVTDTTTVNPVAGVALSPDREGAADPGAVVTYTHILTSTGNSTDIFTLSAVSSQGWAVSHSPDPTLASGVSTTVRVTLTVPVGAPGGTIDETTLSAVSQFDPSVSAAVTETTTVNQVARVSLSPGQTGSGDPGEVVTYTHILTNTGNGPDSYHIDHQSSLGWSVSHNTPGALEPGEQATLVVNITIPADVVSGTVDTTVITAT